MFTRSLVGGKFAKMAEAKFAFLRGTSWLTPSLPSRFRTPASSQLAVMGDPHPENATTFVNRQGARRLEFNDFDPKP